MHVPCVDTIGCVDATAKGSMEIPTDFDEIIHANGPLKYDEAQSVADKNDKVFIISVTYAVVEPAAVMIIAVHTHVTPVTVLCPRGLVHLAYIAETGIGVEPLCLLYLRLRNNNHLVDGVACEVDTIVTSNRFAVFP